MINNYKENQEKQLTIESSTMKPKIKAETVRQFDENGLRIETKEELRIWKSI